MASQDISEDSSSFEPTSHHVVKINEEMPTSETDMLTSDYIYQEEDVEESEESTEAETEDEANVQYQK